MGFKEWVRKQIQEYKLQMMDEEWEMIGGYSWELYPPSFYYRHSKEEIEKIKREDIERLKQILSKL